MESRLINIPVLKAWDRVFELVEAFGDYPYNREDLKDAILRLFGSQKTEKSVFRGMAIPTLRRLGLIIGYSDLIRLSSNGKLVYTAIKESLEVAKRVLSAIVYEMDNKDIKFVELIHRNSPWGESQFINSVEKQIDAPNSTAKKERIRDWLGLIEYCGLLVYQRGALSIQSVILETAKKDVEYSTKENLFRVLIQPAYLRLVRKSKGIMSHHLDELRSELAVELLAHHNIILTEKQFDELLTRLPKTTPKYLIAFGRPMNADEKLFRYEGNQYQTIAFRFFDETE